MADLDEAQARWRDRQREKGLVPRVLYLSDEARAELARQAKEAGVNQHQYVDQLLISKERTMQPDPTEVSYWQENENNRLTLDEAIRQAPTESVRNAIRVAAAQAAQRQQRQDNGSNLSASEQASLERFKVQIAEAKVTERHIQAHGGEQAMDQKARVTASFLANNIHNQK